MSAVRAAARAGLWERTKLTNVIEQAKKVRQTKPTKTGLNT